MTEHLYYCPLCRRVSAGGQYAFRNCELDCPNHPDRRVRQLEKKVKELEALLGKHAENSDPIPTEPDPGLVHYRPSI